MSDDDTMPPEAPVEPARRGLLDRISIVWIVPAVALAVVLAIAAQTYLDRGPLVEISFENASGVKPGTTELRYRDVTVGLVEEVYFTDGLDRVLVSVRLEQEVAPYVDADAEFWVVRPQVTTQGVRGLNTVLSGVYIEGVWDNEAGGAVERFEGLPDAPLNRAGQDGLRLTLRASGKATVTENAPILYRGITVGRVGKPTISADGSTAEAEALIFAPHDRLINDATRFWDASGFSFSLGAGGAALDFSSVAALVSGGIAFDTMVSGGGPAQAGDNFTIFADEAAARASIFAGDDGETVTLTAVFEDNVAGLSVDSPVELNGIAIGRVSALSGIMDPESFGDSRVRLAATLAIRPRRLGLDGETGTQAALDFLRGRIAEGLRARLATDSILTGGLKVELVDVGNGEAPATMPGDGPGDLTVPTTQSDIADVSATAEGVFERINALPVEDVMARAITLMENANRLITDADTRAVPGSLNGLLADARGVIGAPEVQALPARLDAVVGEFEALGARFSRAQLVMRLEDVLDEAAQAARGVNTAVAGVPDLVERLDAVAAKAEAVEIEAAAEELSSLLDAARTLLSGEDTRALPGRLNSALTELAAILSQLREGNVVENARTTLESASDAADTFAAAGSDLPGLIAEAENVLAQARRTLEGYEAGGGLARDTRAALAEVQRAAKAVASLARAIERNPSSLLRGR
ncbi:intermembrane transport protein PqiB [Roseovarius sp. SYSU LYC5161]|uniref:PqiB family protein n=1 Tax=Roseovarius halophilus (ex Wu et al. 2025) TaxID=3376060 RepID=UPI00399B4EC9